jgi:hypothetical protein
MGLNGQEEKDTYLNTDNQQTNQQSKRFRKHRDGHAAKNTYVDD